MRIFKDTGYLIRMIITVIIDMRHFFLVLMIGLLAFSDSFLAIALGNSAEDDRFVTGFVNSVIYTYTVILGGFDLGEFDNSIAYALTILLFLICTVFNMIVMLNLLIAIISESFANVNNNAKNAMYQEMAALISENNYLIPVWRKEKYAKQNLHLLVITDLEAVDTEFSDPIKNTLNEMHNTFEEKIEGVETKIEGLKSHLDKMSLETEENMDEMREMIESITELIKSQGKPEEKKDGKEEVKEEGKENEKNEKSKAKGQKDEDEEEEED
jgi:hypothetical protein